MLRIALALAGTCACAAGSAAEPQAPPGRRVCGWESLDTVPLRVTADGTARTATAGTRVLVLEADPEASFARVKQALSPAADSLVRIKIVLDGGSLLPVTARGRVPVVPPPRSETVESVVGHRVLRRPKGAPADRFADVRLDRGAVRLFVENENPAGKRLSLAELARQLRATEPPATVFALTASVDTPWKQVVSAIVAAACYDRAPGEEPHEVILD